MTKTSPSPESAQGVDVQEIEKQIESLTTESCIKWITEDLARARTMLAVLHEDPNILRLVAMHIQGRAINHLEARKRKATENSN